MNPRGVSYLGIHRMRLTKTNKKDEKAGLYTPLYTLPKCVCVCTPHFLVRVVCFLTNFKLFHLSFVY